MESPTAPVRAMNSDHQTTIRSSTARGPKRSPSQPLGTSNRAYAKAKAPHTRPKSASPRRCSSAMIDDFAEARHVRSRYTIMASVQPKAKTP